MGVGDACGQFLNERVRRISAKRVQVDEIWTYVTKKQAHLEMFDEDQEAKGDQYVFVAIDADTKLVITLGTGQRRRPVRFELAPS